MADRVKNRKVYYKRAVISDPTITLQSALSAALGGQLRKADNRREQFTEDEEIFRLINRFTTYSNTLFCQFIVYEPSRQQAYLKLEPGKDFYEIDSQSSGDKEAFADDVYYFGVRDNDLACIQTRSIREQQLELHLHWLLTTKTDHVDDDVSLEIINQPDTKIYQTIQNRPAKSIKIGSQLYSESQTSTSQTHEEKKRFNITGKAADLIRTAIGHHEYEKIRSLDDDLDEANLEVNLEIKFNRKTTYSGQDVLDRLASSFRHVDGVDYEVEFKGGSRIKGDVMKISAPVQMQITDKGLVDETDLYRQMHEFLILTLLNQLN